MIENNLNGQTTNIAEENIQKLKAIFPEIIAEGKIDFDKLQQVLGNYIETDNERYNFGWNGKSRALRLAQTPSTGTLRPCMEESKDWDTTQNLYIEGDNLEVLKLLQKSYHNKVKMIYIDPPYNTGNDFVYPDDYKDSIENYLKITGQVDEEGKKVGTNNESNGRYHTDWLNMMYPRLRLARNLLKDDGVIFISIDDNEVDNLKKICNEVFGEENFVGMVIWERAFAPKNDAKYFSASHDYIAVYAKNISLFDIGKLKRSQESIDRYKNYDNDTRGLWISDNLTAKTYSEKYDYPIIVPSGRSVSPSHGSCWRVSKEKLFELISENRIWFGENGDNVPRLKRFLNDVQEGMTPTTLWNFKDVGHNQEGRQELKKLFDDKGFFDGPKPIRLLSRILTIANTNKNSIILDFFSGSATTAHAVMQLSAEDGGNRKFIMVQLPEPIDENSEAGKAGYKNICEIGKERIRRAGEKIKAELADSNRQIQLGEESRQPVDIGFKVMKLDSSNIKKWNPDYENFENSLFDIINNYVDGRTELDMVYEIMIKYGLDLAYSVEQIDVNGKKIYSIANGMLIVCLDDKITTDIAKYIVGFKKERGIDEMRVVFKDNGFKDDSNKTNVKEILKCGEIKEFITI